MAQNNVRQASCHIIYRKNGFELKTCFLYLCPDSDRVSAKFLDLFLRVPEPLYK